MSPIWRALVVAAGFVSLALAIVGIFVPLLPTTPFLLLSAFCFSKSSERFHRWLVEHPRLGPPIKDWRERGEVRRSAKVTATAMLVASALFVTFFRTVPLTLQVLIYVSFTGILAVLWTRPEPRKPSQSLPRD